MEFKLRGDKNMNCDKVLKFINSQIGKLDENIKNESVDYEYANSIEEHIAKNTRLEKLKESKSTLLRIKYFIENNN